MNKECIKMELPLTTPLITSYAPYVAIFSILPCYKDTDAWIYNNFINLWSQQSMDTMPVRFSSWNIMLSCPFFSYNILSRDWMQTISRNIIEFIINGITCGYYLYIPCDEYYLPVSDNYLTLHSRHCPLIYGFDKKAEMFLAGDFYHHGKFSLEKIAFNDMENAAIRVKEIPVPSNWKSDFTWYDVVLFKFKENQKYEFNLDIVINSFKNYLYSRHSVLPFEQNLPGEGEIFDILKNKFTFGLANYSVLNQVMEQNKQKITFKDPRPFHAFYDHKIFLVSLMNFLGAHGYLKNVDKYVNLYTEIKAQCLETRDLFLRFLLSLDIAIMDQIIKQYEDISSVEKRLICDLLDDFIR